ncbi:MAG: hypothetical protein KDJ35_00545 [Alphaproteobacteria bacterium]|nr:hypothetical protein [Alphaproteobacteria bacterium]
MKLKALTIITFSLLLTGCITQKIRHDAALNNNEGIFVTKLSCGSGVQVVNVYKSGEKVDHSGFGSFSSTSAGNRVEVLICDDDNYKIMSLPEGQYYLGRFVNNAAARSISESDAVKFDVIRNKINYIGDISILSDSRYSANTWTTTVRNTRITMNPKMKTMLKNDEPILLNKYAYTEKPATR